MIFFGALVMAGAAGMSPDRVPPARDGNIAIMEELCAARAKGKAEAYDLFIARHPKHRLAKQAQAEKQALLAGRRPSRKNCPAAE